MTGVAAMRKIGDAIIPDDLQEAKEAQAVVADSKTTHTENAGASLTAAEIITGILRRAGTLAGAFNDQLPTAALTIAALDAQGGFPIGASKDLAYTNTVATQTATITTNTGWTLTGAMTIATGTSRLFKMIRTGAATMELISLGVLSGA